MECLRYPFPPGPLGSPPPEFVRRLRTASTEPAELPSGDVARVIVRQDDVKEVLGNPRFSRDLCYEGAPRLVEGVDLAAMDPDLLVNMDPPRHTRIRALVAGAFLPRRIERRRPRVREIADELIDALRAKGDGADLVAEFAFPLPIKVICELLGFPPEDRDKFRFWSTIALSNSAMTEDERVSTGIEFFGYIEDFLAKRRLAPGDDLVDDLINARDGEDALTESELARATALLIVAGHETTLTVISRGAFQLLTRPEMYEALVADPARVPVAVDEIIRYHQPADAVLLRRATEEVTLPSGAVVAAGEVVLPSVAAANLDPAVIDDPEEFDPLRAPGRHIGFGHGPHYCLGAGLARMELEIAFESLVRGLPGLRLAVPPEDIEWSRTASVRGPLSLPVSW